MARQAEESPRTAWRALADNLATGLVFLSFFVTHWIAQAIAWASASRNIGWHLLFDLLGLPLVHLAGAQTDQYFVLLSVPNSLIWAAALTYAAARLRSRIDRNGRPGKS
ncbi:MAG TPA: hypothetical protein VGI29_09445 [Candidatus Binataceae bacterium]|jgi:hypothetical protein